jgi:hypothetical protein
MEKKEWKGITLNKCEFQGKITEDPVQSGDYIFMNLETDWVQRDKTGTFTEFPQSVPLMVEPFSSAKSAVERFVKAGRRVHVETFYKTWEVNGQVNYAFSVVRIRLGSKPFESNGSSGSPTPPPAQ